MAWVDVTRMLAADRLIAENSQVWVDADTWQKRIHVIKPADHNDETEVKRLMRNFSNAVLLEKKAGRSHRATVEFNHDQWVLVPMKGDAIGTWSRVQWKCRARYESDDQGHRLIFEEVKQ